MDDVQIFCLSKIGLNIKKARRFVSNTFRLFVSLLPSENGAAAPLRPPRRHRGIELPGHFALNAGVLPRSVRLMRAGRPCAPGAGVQRTGPRRIPAARKSPPGGCAATAARFPRGNRTAAGRQFSVPFADSVVS